MFNRLNVSLIIIASAFVLAISFLYINRETYGSVFVNEIRVADQDAILATLSDEQLIQLGKTICSDLIESLTLSESNVTVTDRVISLLPELYAEQLLASSNRIIIILRYQAIYELCPDKVPVLSNFIELEQND